MIPDDVSMFEEIDANVATRPAPYVSSPEGKAFAKRLWSELLVTSQRLDKKAGQGLKP